MSIYIMYMSIYVYMGVRVEERERQRERERERERDGIYTRVFVCVGERERVKFGVQMRVTCTTCAHICTLYIYTHTHIFSCTIYIQTKVGSVGSIRL